ncbi:MAG: acetolactate synthase large subunit, partial [Lachnospiraceae bacterium]|nr:acetolactate synthase large subunit [Lachnospiraceae bacterium]
RRRRQRQMGISDRFNDRITGKVGQFAKHAVMIHVDIDPASISRNIAVDIPIVADAKKAISALLEKAQPLDTREWLSEIHHWKQQYPLTIKTKGINPEKIIQEINCTFDNAVITTDVGQNQLWATQFLELGGEKQMLTSGGLGTMGYGFPAAIGAKIGNPSKDVIVIAGDGGIQMNIQEMATAVVYELPLIICILNNGYLGNVRQWQEMFFEKRYSSTCMRYRKSCANNCNTPTAQCPEYTPDFMQLAKSYGANGIRVTAEKDIAPAFKAAKNSSNVPTVIEFIIAPEENVLPIVPPGNALEDMILESEDNRK